MDNIQRFHEIHSLYKDGYTMSWIGDLYKISHVQVWRILRSTGVPRKKVELKQQRRLGKEEDLNEKWFPIGVPEWKKKGRDRVREKVRFRDKYICQGCDKKWEEGQRSFDIHHIDGLCGKKSRGYDGVNDMHKLITLCHKCHFNRHGFSKNLNG